MAKETLEMVSNPSPSLLITDGAQVSQEEDEIIETEASLDAAISDTNLEEEEILPVQEEAQRRLSLLPVRKFQSNFAKFARGVKLSRGLHFGCRACEVADDITSLCGVERGVEPEPDGNCMCHRIRMIKPDTINIGKGAGLVYIPDDIHGSLRDGTEWASLADICFRLEVHKCTTCHTVLAHRYVNIDIEKHLVMTWSGELRKVELQDGAPEPYFITQSKNLTILKETEGADE